MRVFICLSVFSFMVATCQETCFSDPLKPLHRNGLVVGNICVDRYDGKTHPIASRWKTADCYICNCRRDGMRCCQSTQRRITIDFCKLEEMGLLCYIGGSLDENVRCSAV